MNGCLVKRLLTGAGKHGQTFDLQAGREMPDWWNQIGGKGCRLFKSSELQERIVALLASDRRKRAVTGHNNSLLGESHDPAPQGLENLLV